MEKHARLGRTERTSHEVPNPGRAGSDQDDPVGELGWVEIGLGADRDLRVAVQDFMRRDDAIRFAVATAPMWSQSAGLERHRATVQ